MYKKELHNNRVLGNFFSIKFVHIRKSCLNLIPMKNCSTKCGIDTNCYKHYKLVTKYTDNKLVTNNNK